MRADVERLIASLRESTQIGRAELAAAEAAAASRFEARRLDPAYSNRSADQLRRDVDAELAREKKDLARATRDKVRQTRNTLAKEVATIKARAERARLEARRVPEPTFVRPLSLLVSRATSQSDDLQLLVLQELRSLTRAQQDAHDAARFGAWTAEQQGAELEVLLADRHALRAQLAPLQAWAQAERTGKPGNHPPAGAVLLSEHDSLATRLYDVERRARVLFGLLETPRPKPEGADLDTFLRHQKSEERRLALVAECGEAAMTAEARAAEAETTEALAQLDAEWSTAGLRLEVQAMTGAPMAAA